MKLFVILLRIVITLAHIALRCVALLFLALRVFLVSFFLYFSFRKQIQLPLQVTALPVRK